MKHTTTADEIAVFGAHGHTMMILRALMEYWQGAVRPRVLIDDLSHGFIHPQLNIPVISSADRLRDYPDLPVLVTPGSSALRAEVAARLVQEDATFFTAGCPDQPHVDPGVEYGAGCVIRPHTRFGPDVRIGEGAQVLSNLIAHDIEIGAFSTLNADSSVLGHVIIGRGVTVAPLAVIGNGSHDRPLRIGDGAVIAIGAVVVRDVAPGAVMVGNPAMTVERWKAFSRWLDTQ